MTEPGEKQRAPRGWLVPLLWLLIPALAAVAPGLWKRWRAPGPTPFPALPPLTLTGRTLQDRQAILGRAATVLLYPRERIGLDVPLSRAALMGEIGLELLPLDTARGTQCVERAIDMAASRPDQITPTEIDAPERSRTGLLLHLARSLKPYPALAEKTVQTALDWAQGNEHLPSRVFALCLFAREAAGIDPVRARSALLSAQGIVSRFPDDAPADPIAAVAAATARVEGRAAARPVVERALRAVPRGRARPLVEARLAAWLSEAAPPRARALARQAVIDARGESQWQAVAVLLAPAHPDLAQAAANRLPAPAERAAVLIEMGAAAEARAPDRAAALYRRALHVAQAMPDAHARQEAVVAAATGLAATDLAAARAAVAALPGPVPAVDLMMLGVRAVKRAPAAAGRLIEQTRDGNPASARTIEGSYDLSLAEVVAQPDPGRALALAQQARNPELQAAALLAVAKRLKG